LEAANAPRQLAAFMPAGTLQVADRDRRANSTGAQGLRLDTIGGRWRLGLFHLQEAFDPSRPPPPGRLRSAGKYLQLTTNLKSEVGSDEMAEDAGSVGHS